MDLTVKVDPFRVPPRRPVFLSLQLQYQPAKPCS